MLFVGYMNLCPVVSSASCHQLFCQIKIKDACTDRRSEPPNLTPWCRERGAFSGLDTDVFDWGVGLVTIKGRWIWRDYNSCRVLELRRRLWWIAPCTAAETQERAECLTARGTDNFMQTNKDCHFYWFCFLPPFFVFFLCRILFSVILSASIRLEYSTERRSSDILAHIAKRMYNVPSV